MDVTRKNTLSLKYWIIILVNFLIIVAVMVTSLAFYKAFSKTLNQRVLLHLSSIQELKRIQIENYVNGQWSDFINSKEKPTDEIENKKIFQLIDSTSTTGIYDITDHMKSEKLALLFLDVGSKAQRYKILISHPIEEILLERTGMGRSGETYIVASDFRLRSSSRFFPKTNPLDIEARTKGVKNALAGDFGKSIFEDYRNVSVFSVYHKLDIPYLPLVILTEIDETEINQPLKSLQLKLMLICLTTLLLSIVTVLILSDKITNPIKRMSFALNQISKGNYHIQTSKGSRIKEINEMLSSLNRLVKVIQGAIDFSSSVGNLQFDQNYQLIDDESLKPSLISMRDKLVDFNKSVSQKELESKKWIFIGQEKERKRLAQGLHDGLGPLLTSLKMRVQATDTKTEEKEMILKLLDETINEVRQVSFNLMPSILVDFGIGKTVEKLVSLLNQSSDSQIEFINNTLNNGTSKNADIDIYLYRIIQELINNSLKHTVHSKITFSLTEFEDKISLYYEDNGNGFEIDKVKKGAGLNNIRDRINIMNGLFVTRKEQCKMCFEVEIPK